MTILMQRMLVLVCTVVQTDCRVCFWHFSLFFRFLNLFIQNDANSHELVLACTPLSQTDTHTYTPRDEIMLCGIIIRLRVVGLLQRQHQLHRSSSNHKESNVVCAKPFHHLKIASIHFFNFAIHACYSFPFRLFLFFFFFPLYVMLIVVEVSSCFSSLELYVPYTICAHVYSLVHYHLICVGKISTSMPV